MNIIFPSRKIYISESAIDGAGRGVFAKLNIKKGEIIEQCPVVEIPEYQVDLLRRSELLNYYFLWGEKMDCVAIALGFGSIYNHSYTPDATYIKDIKGKVIEFVALKDIKKGEEITVNYNSGDPDNKSPLWIKSIKPAT